MTYHDIQLSVNDARPAELYEIRYTNNVWYYTSASEDIVYGGNTYLSIYIERTEIEPGTVTTKNSVEVKMTDEVPLADIFKVRPPSELVMLTIRAIDYIQPGAGYEVIWKGRIVNASYGVGILEVSSENIFTSLRRMALRRRFQVRCPYTIYSTKCGVNRLDYKETYPVTAITGDTITLPGTIGKVAGVYAGGYVEWVNADRGNTEMMMVRSFDTATGEIKLTGPGQGLYVGADVSIYRGCGHTLGAGGCADFNNQINYGGMPFKPGQNPFNGTSIF